MESNVLPVSIMIGSTNQHDSTKLIDVMENIHQHLDDDAIEQIVSVYADKGYDAKYIQEYLRNRNIADCIPKRNFKSNKTRHAKYNKTRYVVERFFA